MNAQFPNPEKTAGAKRLPLGKLRPATKAAAPGKKSLKDTENQTEKPSTLEMLLMLEARVREALSLSELQFLIANETRKLVTCRQVVLFRGKPSGQRWRIEKISSVAEVDRTSPLLKWLAQQTKEQLLKNRDISQGHVQLDLDISRTNLKYPFKKGVYLPFNDRFGNELGGMLLLSETELNERDISLATRLSKTFGHAWSAIKPAPKTGWFLLSRRNLFVALIVMVLIGFVPVKLTVLSPLEVVARDAFIIAAPIEGVIEEVLVSPNARVRKGDLLFRYHALDFENRNEIATKNMAIASARYQRASQSSFGSGDGRRELAITKAEYEVAVEEKRYATSQLERIEVRAQSDGIALFSSKDDWTGRPVAIGERIMRLADANKTEFKIKVAVADGIILGQETDVTVFLDSDPLNPLPAKVSRKSYTPEKQGDEPMAFPVHAQLKPEENTKNIRIGLRGTARLSGDRVPLAFNLLRKPLSAIRQYLGI